MQPLTADATSAFLRAVRGVLAGLGEIRVEEVRSRAWASATFAGARHELSLRVEGAGCVEGAEALRDKLTAAEFVLRGHLVADIASSIEEHDRACDGQPFVRVRIEALTVEDC